MSLPAIGVVIPCYKAEHTLRQTVESVLQGAPDNLQLVLVEDGSPDGTGALCDALAAQDPRVTALHQPNGGASAARNAGLDTLCRQRCRVGAVCGCGRYPAAGAVASAARCI